MCLGGGVRGSGIWVTLLLGDGLLEVLKGLLEAGRGAQWTFLESPSCLAL